MAVLWRMWLPFSQGQESSPRCILVPCISSWTYWDKYSSFLALTRIARDDVHLAIFVHLPGASGPIIRLVFHSFPRGLSVFSVLLEGGHTCAHTHTHISALPFALDHLPDWDEMEGAFSPPPPSPLPTPPYPSPLHLSQPIHDPVLSIHAHGHAVALVAHTHPSHTPSSSFCYSQIPRCSLAFFRLVVY
jgi:hypothetical protein